MILEDSLNDSCTSNILSDKIKAELKPAMPERFFTTSYKTLIKFSDETTEKKNIFPLFKHIGGCQDQIKSIKIFIDDFMKCTIRANQERRMLLLTGPNGVGKTTVLQAILNEYIACATVLDGKTLFTYLVQKSSDILQSIKELLKSLSERSPSILIVDDLHKLLTSKALDTSDIDPLYKLISLCDKRILIVAAVSAEFQKRNKLLDCFLVDEINFSKPSYLDREEIINKILDNFKHSLSPNEVKECAALTEGMTSKEIFKAIKHDSVMLSLIRIKNTTKREIEHSEYNLILKDLETALRKRKSHIMSSDLKKEEVKWGDIGGMDSIKDILKKEIQLFQISPEIIKRFSYTPSRGILLYGPPGCSKTMIAKALATECNWNFISKKASDLLNMYVGESEKAIAELFCKAKERAPCIIFLDEIDSLASDRYSSASASGVGNRIVTTLLAEMDGFEILKDVLIVAATNQPNIIDAALLRSGRLGKHIYVPLPDSAARQEIFKLSMKRRTVGSSVDFKYLVERTEGYTGAEIVHLCNEAALQVLTEDPHSCVFEIRHFENALQAVPPRTSKKLIQFYEEFSSKSR